jgi:Cof subfamily protein (haloacid dehalogenase superfamily)
MIGTLAARKRCQPAPECLAVDAERYDNRVPRYDLVALDLDGTLLNPAEEISPRNRLAIRQALEAGVRVVLVTGRGVDAPQKIARDLDLNVPFICCHGALTKDFLADKVLGHIPVPLQYAKPMVDFAESHQLSIAIYDDEHFYYLEGTERVMKDMRPPVWRTVRTFRDALKQAPTFIRFLGTRSVETMRPEFAHFPLHFKYESWGEFEECAVTSLEATKKNALIRLCADFQIPAARVMAVGDSRNDVPMLRWAGLGIAMENALLEVREAIPIHTGSNERDGVADAIERYVLKTSSAGPEEAAHSAAVSKDPQVKSA